MTRAYVALGSNIGDARVRFDAALEHLRVAGDVVARSRLYVTKPWGYEAQANFTNAVVSVDSTLSCVELMDALKRIEKALGKTVICENGPRVIDLDLLFYDDCIFSTKDLILPHPRAHERDFVLLPMCDIAADYEHPLLKKPMRALLEALESHTFTGDVCDWD